MVEILNLNMAQNVSTVVFDEARLNLLHRSEVGVVGKTFALSCCL